MARIEEKIAEIADPALRQAIDEEVKALKKNKQFGLVFEAHSPEVVPMPRVPVKRDATVAKKAGKLTEVWQVVRLQGDTAELVRDGVDGKPVHDTASVDSLLVVRRMAEPIFPALQPVDSVHNGPSDAPHHILIEADNYHALQLLTYAYAGKVDCIYLDPPYNTGARDWKYNNDFVDVADQWRHSKWLTFMEKRLQLAERLLKTDGVLIVTIDEHEVHNLGVLLQQTLHRARDIQMVTIVMNTAGSMSPGKFSRAEEYAFFCFYGAAKPLPMRTDLLSEAVSGTQFWFPLFRSRGLNDRPSRRPNLVYPIAIDPATLRVVGTGRSLKQRVIDGDLSGDLDAWLPDPMETINGYPLVWPVLDSGEVSTWQVSSTSLPKLQEDGFVRVRKSTSDSGPRAFSIQYVKSGNRKKVFSGEVEIIGREPGGAYILQGGARSSVPKSTWKVATHDARQYGTTMLRNILGSTSFTYPKSPYATADALRSVLSDRQDALILDFFAGSGTTLQSTLMLNNEDGGSRRCILVTNNEIPNEATSVLSSAGFTPGDDEWEMSGICRAVTWPRNKFTILGKRDDGTVLDGEYQTGRTVSKEKGRNIRQLGFAEGNAMTLPQRKQLAALIPALPQSKLEAKSPWFLDEDLPVSVLWDVQQAEAWLDELADADHLTDVYVVTTENRMFTALSKKIKETLGPMFVDEDEKLPMANGFPANLNYFKLDFLEPSAVALGRQFEGILPILWMMAGSCGPCPLTPENGYAHLHWLVPDVNPFAVLMRETRFREFQTRLAARPDLTHIFLVTNSDKAFHDMKADLPDQLTVIQLYKSYLDNFKINTQQV